MRLSCWMSCWRSASTSLARSSMSWTPSSPAFRFPPSPEGSATSASGTSTTGAGLAVELDDAPPTGTSSSLAFSLLSTSASSSLCLLCFSFSTFSSSSNFCMILALHSSLCATCWNPMPFLRESHPGHWSVFPYLARYSRLTGNAFTRPPLAFWPLALGPPKPPSLDSSASPAATGAGSIKGCTTTGCCGAKASAGAPASLSGSFFT